MTTDQKVKMAGTAKTAGIFCLILGLVTVAVVPFMFTAGGIIRFGIIIPLMFFFFSQGCFKYKKQLEAEIAAKKD